MPIYTAPSVCQCIQRPLYANIYIAPSVCQHLTRGVKQSDDRGTDFDHI